MAITSSAKKAHRASLNKRVFNVRRKKALTSAIKLFNKTLVSDGATEAEKILPEAYKAIDKANKRGVIKNNTASRKKSRLVASMRRAESKTKVETKKD